VALNRLFLYGTLLPGLVRPPFDALVATLTLLGLATVRGRLYDLGPYPGLVLDEDASPVRGELFALPNDSALLAALDDYEGSCLYRRVECRATTAAGETATCWVYECHADLSRAVVIPHGDYRRWHAAKPVAGNALLG
jgi:gamma-glutamylcyclotransferase (GGCT)/AIG2-like uncharacterized protein YtfP